MRRAGAIMDYVCHSSGGERASHGGVRCVVGGGTQEAAPSSRLARDALAVS